MSCVVNLMTVRKMLPIGAVVIEVTKFGIYLNWSVLIHMMHTLFPIRTVFIHLIIFSISRTRYVHWCSIYTFNDFVSFAHVKIVNAFW